MLEYEKEIFLSILQEDGLVVAAKGLGLESVLVNLLKVNCDPGNLVFVLGTEGKHQEWLVSTLITSGTNPAPRVISSEIGVSERESTYLEGGVFFVPTRILVVDLLKNRIPVELVTGFVVWKAHNIIKNHQESFILKLFRQKNQTGFIKAFSNHAPGLVGGISKVNQVMKSLFVSKLFLWPRYHAGVKNCLSAFKPKVIELNLEMSNSMLQLQNAILDLIKCSIQEMKRLNPMLDADEVTVENALCDSFHKILHSQLDPMWHALSDRTKLLLADLKLFHSLIRALITYDSVSFYSLVKQQQSSKNVQAGSGWQMLPAAEILFSIAALRVHPDRNFEEIDPEPSPKWLALAEVMAEIHRDLLLKQNEETVEGQMEEMFEGEVSKCISPQTQRPNILVLVRDERTCSQLQKFLMFGSKELLETQYRKCFGLKQSAEKKDITEDEEPNKSENVPEADENEDLNEDCILNLSQAMFSQMVQPTKVSLAGCFEESFAKDEGTSDKTIEDLAATSTPNIIIKAWTKEIVSLLPTLSELMPRWVVMYDVDMTTVRQLEVFQRSQSALPLTIYFLIFGGTVEEQAYLTSLRIEKNAFDSLIEEKARLVIPEDRSDDPQLMRTVGQIFDVVDNSRKGGLEPGTVEERQRVIVDMREFRSELPALIHARGIDVEPLTITVGDYILTPDICIERKSVSDLIQSLNSGRLYNQAQSLTRYYSRPMLLIEFDKDKPFDIQDRYYLSTDTNSEQLVTKLQLLTIHFPQLRLVWSPSPLATAALFQELKKNQPDPDPSTALATGLQETIPSELAFNPAIQSFLIQLPGITCKNITTLMSKGASLDNVRKMSVEELTTLFENSATAKSVHDAIHLTHEAGLDVGNKRFLSAVSNFRGKRRKRFH